MTRKQKLFIKIILAGNILFILSDILKDKAYWVGWQIAKPQTWWQHIIEVSHYWWYGLAEETKVCLVFTITGIIFLIGSFIMDD